MSQPVLWPFRPSPKSKSVASPAPFFPHSSRGVPPPPPPGVVSALSLFGARPRRSGGGFLADRPKHLVPSPRLFPLPYTHNTTPRSAPGHQPTLLTQGFLSLRTAGTRLGRLGQYRQKVRVSRRSRPVLGQGLGGGRGAASSRDQRGLGRWAVLNKHWLSSALGLWTAGGAARASPLGQSWDPPSTGSNQTWLHPRRTLKSQRAAGPDKGAGRGVLEPMGLAGAGDATANGPAAREFQVAVPAPPWGRLRL